MSYPNIIQKHNNDIQTIKSTYLPLSGGILTGFLRTTSYISKATDDTFFDIYGGTSHQRGSQLTLFGYEHTNAGLAQISSYDKNGNHCAFQVFPNGKIVTNGNYYHSDTTSRVFFCGGTYTEDGSHLEVTGKDCVGDFGGGAFSLRAKDGTQTASFDGYANGGLYWRGKPVVCRENYGGTPAWIKFDNGLTVQWGYTYVAGNTTNITFPIPFAQGIHCIQVTPAITGNDNNTTVQVNGWTNTYFNPSFWDSDTTASRSGYIFWTAFGY